MQAVMAAVWAAWGVSHAHASDLLWDDVQRVPLVKDDHGHLYSCKDRGAAITQTGSLRCLVVSLPSTPGEDKGGLVPMSLEEIVRTHVVAPAGKNAVPVGIIPAMAGCETASKADQASVWVAVRFR